MMGTDAGRRTTAEVHQLALETNREACCPSCGKVATFTFGGFQEWPLKVAQITGLQRVQSLWHCSKCRSTFTDLDLHF